MPLIVERDSYAQCLDPAPHETGELLDMLVPAAPGRLDAFEVSKAVGNVADSGPGLILPLPADGGTIRLPVLLFRAGGNDVGMSRTTG